MSIDPHLMAAAELLLYEKVEIYNLTNGNRFETWVVSGTAGGGQVCLSGAEHLVKAGDQVVITSYCVLHSGQTLEHRPKLVLVDEKNRVKVLQEGEAATPLRPDHAAGFKVNP